MPDYHDIFWKLIFLRLDCAIEFFRFLLKEKAEFLELENLLSIQEIYYRKKKLLYDILYEIINGRIRWVSLFRKKMYYE